MVSPERGYVFHNRLTHSLKVAQLSRTIAELFLQRYPDEVRLLGGIDPDAAEAAGLAHDLGHPPFGHIAEHALNELVRANDVRDGFEGNAQSFRIVCRLATSDALTPDAVSLAGLNLTRETLNGIIKYPWHVDGNPAKPSQWGYYSEEREHFEWARQRSPAMQRCLVAEIIDWADDVTYAMHDLLDFYRAGMIPLEQIRKTAGENIERTNFLHRVFERRQDWVPRREIYEVALDRILDLLPFDMSHRYAGTEADEQLLYQFSTQLITQYVLSITPIERDGSLVTVQQIARDQVDVLKEFVWAYVILNPDLAVLQAGQRKAIKTVFEAFFAEARNTHLSFFPSGFRHRIRDCASSAQRVRVVSDYVAGMTERELMGTYRRLEGIASH